MKVLWDAAKARSNQKKHGISFSDAEAVFYDPYAISMEDVGARNERRHVSVGKDSLGRVITAVYAYRAGNIRLISARKATGAETSIYEEGIRFQ